MIEGLRSSPAAFDAGAGLGRPAPATSSASSALSALSAAPSRVQPRRASLNDLDTQIHCSVIGTCIGTATLRKLVARHTDLDRERASDLEVHHEAVKLAVEGGAGAKALHKLLDEIHAAGVKRFDAAPSAEALLALWAESLDRGDIPGAYWALMTHPLATAELRRRAFGDVHMLSHLVGAANRADIRRLVTLERDRAALQAQAEQLQARLQDAHAARENDARRLGQTVAELRAEIERRDAIPGGAENLALREALQEKDRRIALHAARRDEAERELQSLRLELEDAACGLERSQLTVGFQREEIQTLEAALSPPHPAADDEPGVLRRSLAGRRVLYVGGRPSSTPSIRRLVEQAGGEWLHHDGGVEDRKGLLAAALPRADWVLFPVDCIDHDSAQVLKRLCVRHGLPYQPLRSASVASFVAAVVRLDPPLANGAALASAFCLKHG